MKYSFGPLVGYALQYIDYGPKGGNAIRYYMKYILSIFTKI